MEVPLFTENPRRVRAGNWFPRIHSSPEAQRTSSYSPVRYSCIGPATTTRACFQSYREFGAMRLSDSHTTHEEGAATMQTPPLPQWSWHCLEAAWPFPQRYEHGARPPGRTVQG